MLSRREGSDTTTEGHFCGGWGCENEFFGRNLHCNRSGNCGDRPFNMLQATKLWTD